MATPTLEVVMKQSDVKIYKDPDDFETLGNAIKYPCSTQYMEYRAMVSRYFLTTQALEEYGIRIETTHNPKALEQFIEEITDDIYDVMARLAPFNFQYNSYLVAQSLSAKFPNRYAARKQFEKALIYQAQYRMKNFDVRDFNGIDFENNTSIYHKQLRKEFRHISPKSMDILKALGLLFNGHLPGKHLIDYKNLM